jgi:hypothetical protein
MLKHSPYFSRIMLKNVANNIIWADSSVFRYLSADKWKYGILVNVKNAAETNGSCLAARQNWGRLNAFTETCIVEEIRQPGKKERGGSIVRNYG